MIQSLILSILALLGFAPATPAPAHSGRVGPGPNGRRRAVLPAPATASAPSTGPGPGGRRHAIHRVPSPRVVQAVVHPVEQPARPVVQPGAARELAHGMSIRTTGLVRRIPAGRAVRWLQSQAGCAPSDQGLPGVTRAEVDLSLSADLTAYVELCLRERTPLPGISPAREHDDDSLYRLRLARACVDDIELWEAAARSRDRQRADAEAAGRPQPPSLRLPHEVELVIARRAAAALAALKRRKEAAGGTAGKAGGGNVVAFPGADQAPALDAPPPEGHDAEVPSSPGLK